MITEAVLDEAPLLDAETELEAGEEAATVTVEVTDVIWDPSRLGEDGELLIPTGLLPDDDEDCDGALEGAEEALKGPCRSIDVSVPAESGALVVGTTHFVQMVDIEVLITVDTV